MNLRHEGGFSVFRVVLGLLLFCGLLGAGIWAYRVPLRAKDLPSQAITTTIEIKKGMSSAEISSRLEELKVIESAQQFRLIGRVLRSWSKVKTGEYRVNSSQSPLEIFSVLNSGISIVYPVTIKEGANLYEVAQAIAAQGLTSSQVIISLAKSPEFALQTLPQEFKESVSASGLLTLEGFLFPDTYHFTKVMTPEDMLRQMVRRFQSAWSADLKAASKQLGMASFEVLILASMIEKETGAPYERPIISSVFHNRLRKRMKLQSDPTTIYGMWERYTGNIKKSDLLTHSAHNTYTIPALPIGPIANPGREAMTAAIKPETSEYLFFVSKNDGTHFFSRTYEEHNKGVRSFQLDPKARKGKSWRDLKRSAANARSK